jgi:hypothetical protein
VTAQRTAALPELVIIAPRPPSSAAISEARVATVGLPNRVYACPGRWPEKSASASSDDPKSKIVLCTIAGTAGRFSPRPASAAGSPACAQRVCRLVQVFCIVNERSAPEGVPSGMGD